MTFYLGIVGAGSMPTLKRHGKKTSFDGDKSRFGNAFKTWSGGDG